MFKRKQQGVALIVFVMLLMITAASLFILNSKKVVKPKLKASLDTQLALSQAKDALITFSLGYFYKTSSSLQVLGRLPFPDRNDDAPDYYDGESDCFSGAVGSNLLIGKFPWRREGSPCLEFEINTDVKDSSGERLWYAVSRNMIKNSVNTVFTPDTLNINTNWITVYDQSGNTLSDRVAFVLLAPGKAINGQTRTATSPAIRYLDSFDVPGVGVVNNHDTVLDFVVADESDTFNDKLVYVTIDQLMPLIEKRVLSEFRTLLQNHQTNNGAYPWPALLGDQTNNCDNTRTSGFISIDPVPIPDPLPCPNNETLTIPGIQNYLHQWLPFIYYAVRSDCVATNTTGCGNQINGNELSLDGVNNKDVILISTGRAITTLTTMTPPYNQDRSAAVPPAHNRREYLDDQDNIDQNYVMPTLSINNNDQITTL